MPGACRPPGVARGRPRRRRPLAPQVPRRLRVRRRRRRARHRRPRPLPLERTAPPARAAGGGRLRLRRRVRGGPLRAEGLPAAAAGRARRLPVEPRRHHAAALSPERPGRPRCGPRGRGREGRRPAVVARPAGDLQRGRSRPVEVHACRAAEGRRRAVGGRRSRCRRRGPETRSGCGASVCSGRTAGAGRRVARRTQGRLRVPRRRSRPARAGGRDRRRRVVRRRRRPAGRGRAVE